MTSAATPPKSNTLLSLARKVWNRAPSLLREVGFRRYWTAQSVSYIGDQVSMVGLPLIAILVLNASTAEIGLLAAAHMVPNLLISLHAGAWVDRRGRRREVMIVMDIARAVVLVSVPIAYYVNALTMVHLYLVALLIGSMAIVFNVANQGLFADLVSRNDYVQASTLSKGSFSFSWIAGPGIGGWLVQVLSAPAALLIDTVSFIWSALLLRSISVDESPGDRKASSGHVREGLRFLRRTKVLRAKFIAGSALNFFYTVYFTLLVLFVVRELHLPVGLVGLAIGLGAVGALLGAVVTGRVIKRIGLGMTFLIGSFVYPAANFLVPLAGGGQWLVFALVTAAEFAAGFGMMMLDISGNTIQLALTPDRFRARIQGAYMAISYGARPLGAVVAGVLGEWIGLRPTLWIAIVGGVLSILPLLPSPIVRMRETPAQAE